MLKLYLDPGHGGSDQGASGNGLVEKNLTLDISLRIRDLILNQYQDVSVNMSRTTDTTVSLAARTNEANSWGADFLLSIHINSFNGDASGYEDYIHSSLSDSSQTAQLQQILHEEIIAVNGLSDRGAKKADFHMLRESVMNALLTENGFITSSSDAAKLKDPAWRQKVAQGHVNGLARAFGLVEKEPAEPNPMYDLAIYGSDTAILSSSDPARHAEKVEELLRQKVDGVQVVKRT